MRHETHEHLKGQAFERPGSVAEEDLWTVIEVFFKAEFREAHAVLVSAEGERAEVPVSHLRYPFWRPLD